MRHKRRTKTFSRKPGPRKALIRGLVNSLVEHGRITTTVDKAKELRRHIERAITIGKKQDLATRRLLLSKYPNQNTVSTILDDLSQRFSERPGGYTRIIKIGRRPGDTAEMAFIEFVDFDFNAKKSDNTEVADKKAEKTKSTKATKTTAKAKAKSVKAKVKTGVVAKKKSVKKIQKKARAAARA
jgi:large subunit ribosomal protein L17